jgi:CBS-domain-containing membrane protein
MNATVKDVMTTHPVAVRLTASYKDMAAKLREFRISAFPVLDEDSMVVGVVSEADLLTKEAFEYSPLTLVGGMLHSRDRAKAAGVTAADLMSKPAVTIGPDEPVSRAARLMYDRRVKRLPVVDDDGRLIGIVTRADVLSVYARPDEDICRDIIDNVIVGTILTDPARFAVTVKDGVVTVTGEPESTRVGQDMLAEIRHVEGVVAVTDGLDYPPPVRPAAVAGLDYDF